MHEKKTLKYSDLMAECNVWLFPVEVSYRWFPAQSMRKLRIWKGIGKSMKDRQQVWANWQRGHLSGYGTVEMICAGSRDLSSSGLAITADPATGRCHTCNTGSRHLVKVGRRSKPKDDHKAENTFSYRHKKIAKKLYPKCFINTSESLIVFQARLLVLWRVV